MASRECGSNKRAEGRYVVEVGCYSGTCGLAEEMVEFFGKSILGNELQTETII